MTRKLTGLLAGLLSLMAASSVSAQSELFMSEYIEGTGNNKAIEIYNGTGSAVNMTTGNYVLELYSNGAATPSASVSLTATIANGDVYVLCNGSANAAVLAQCDLTSNSVINFNGDDAVVLRKGGAAGSVIDIIGQINFDPGTAWSSGMNSTLNKTLLRKGEKCVGDTNPNDAFNPSVDWNTENVDTFTFLGSHAAACSTAGTLQFSAATYSVAENGASATITVTRTLGSTGAVTVDYTTADGTTNPANQPGDYTTASGTLNFADGDTSETFSVTINNDATPEADETVNLTLSAPGGGAILGAQSTAVLTITNDDVAPEISINNVTQAEGNAGTTTFSFTVSLDMPAPAGGISFDIATQDSTATDADNDYEPRSLNGQSIAEGASTYSFDVTVNGDTAVEANEQFFVNLSNISMNAIPGTTQGVGTLTNDDIYRIHDIQGSGATSALDGTAGVTVRGIVTGRSGTGAFWMQEEDADADADPATSEGLFIFRSSGTLPAVTVGDLVEVTGTVTEFSSGGAAPVTELAGSPSVTILSSGNALPTPVDLLAALPVGSTTYTSTTFERFEGMRVSAAELDVIAPNAPNGGQPNETTGAATVRSDFYVVLGGVARPMREPGIPASDNPTVTFPGYTGPEFDENPEKLRFAPLGQTGGTARIADAGDALANFTGIMDQFQGNYSLLPDPAGYTYLDMASITAARAAEYDEFTVAGANLFRLFDDVNDPDFSNSNEPVANTPYYENRLIKASRVICLMMGSPDIIGTVEVENIEVLQDLAAAVQANTTDCGEAPPTYAAYLLTGNDIGSIDVGFLVRTDPTGPGEMPRVEVLDADPGSAEVVLQIGNDTLFRDSAGNPAAGDPLNDRPSLVLMARIHAENGNSEDVTVVVNHLRSLSGVDSTGAGSNGYATGGARVRAKRHQQAVELAQWIDARQDANPDERIILLGDFNAFEFNDGYGHSMGTITGRPVASDSDVVTPAVPGVPSPSTDLVDIDLTNMTLAQPADERYSFVFDNTAQSLDHAVVNQNVLEDFVVDIEHARINADFNLTHYTEFGLNDVTRNADHDPVVLYMQAGSFQIADLAVAVVAPASPVKVGRTAQFGVGVSNGGPADSGATTLTLVLDAANPGMTATAPGGWSCGAALVVAETTTITCTTSNVADGTTPSLNVNVPVTDALSHRTLVLTATVAGTTVDLNLDNNSDSDSVTTIAEANLRTSFSGTSLAIRPNVLIPVYLRLDNYGADSAVNVVVDITANAPASAVSIVTPPGWSCASTSTATVSYRCTIARFPRGTQLFTLKTVAPLSSAGSSINFTGDARSDSTDPAPGNNDSEYILLVKASSLAPVRVPTN